VKPLSGKDLCKLVEKYGWYLLRIHGNHHIYGKPGTIVRLSIPVHKNRPLKTGLFRHLLKQAGIADEDKN
jgi:predicted RNA binding protein YcfA (HicA-like mRNA interferase family)